jgi:hypothetical protein
MLNRQIVLRMIAEGCRGYCSLGFGENSSPFPTSVEVQVRCSGEGGKWSCARREAQGTTKTTMIGWQQTQRDVTGYRSVKAHFHLAHDATTFMRVLSFGLTVASPSFFRFSRLIEERGCYPCHLWTPFLMMGTRPFRSRRQLQVRKIRRTNIRNQRVGQHSKTIPG